jgi:hypothetical protein
LVPKVTSPNLENLARIGRLKLEPPARDEFAGLLSSARSRLRDSRNPGLAIDSRFDLAYNAAHAASLAGLRWNGFRSADRYLVFQVLPHTLGVAEADWRVLAHCHSRRNIIEYEGSLFEDPRLLDELIAAAERVLAAATALPPIGS